MADCNTPKIYPHDRLMAKTVLRLISDKVKPNHVTVARMILTPLVLWLVFTERYAVGIPFFVLVAFTDAIDGSLARTRRLVTDWGTAWDPVADKLLIGSVALIMLWRHFPLELTVVIVGLEAIFLIGGYYWKKQGVIVSANFWGKLKMLSQVIGVTLYLCSLAFGFLPLAYASYGVFGLAVIFALGSLYRHGL